MLYFIVNPGSKSGLGKKRWHILKHKLDESFIVYEAHMTQKGAGAGKIVSAILEREARQPGKGKLIIGVLGGDGTVNEVVNAIAGLENVAIAYFPTGSSNDLARSLHLETDPDLFIAGLKNEPEQFSDLGTVSYGNDHKRLFCVSCGIGLDAAVCKEALDSKFKDTLNRIGLGKLTYAGIAVKQLIKAPVTSCDITFHDGTVKHFEKLLLASTFIQPYEGGGIKFAPMANHQDGKFDICVIAELQKWRALYLLPLAFFGKHTFSKNVHFFHTDAITIQTADPLVVHADGEFCGTLQKISLQCDKKALNYL